MGKKFRFIHVADTHLGHAGNASRYNEYKSLRIHKKADNGLNIRQDDIDRAFSQVIDLAIEHEVDAVLHTGDSWDFWKDNPIVENVHTREVTRLYPHGIKYVEIVGNHDLPKVGGKGCHLETLGRFPEVYTVFKGMYEVVELEDLGVAIHCVPSTFSQEVLTEEISKVSPVSGKINIGMGHFGVTSIKHYAENAENSLVVSLDDLINCKMDYFALGDYHAPTDFGHNIRYSGSIERLGFDEIANDPQILLVEIDQDTKEVQAKPLYLNVRPMIELPSVDASGKTIDEINEAIFKSINSSSLKEKIVRLRVRNLPTHLKRHVDQTKIRDLTEESLFFRLELVDKVNKTKEAKTAGKKFAGVLEGWDIFVNEIEDDGSFDKEELKKEGKNGLMEVYENEAF